MSESESSIADDEIILDKTGEVPETGDLKKLTYKLTDLNITDLLMKKELEEIVQDFKDREALPDLVAELIVEKKLNTMVLDLYDYERGYAISFSKFGEEELFHGEYSYAVSLTEYIRDGEIPYEVFDNLCKYNFRIFYDGYVICQLRIHFEQEKNMRSHYILLKHSIQTIDAECSMKCKADSNLNFEEERARLIKYYSPDLCLDPNPVVSEVLISYELNQFPFLTPYLKHIIQNEKARREKGVQMMKKPKPHESAPEKQKVDKKEDWNFRLNKPTPEEVELSKSGQNLKYKDSLANYLKERPICFPDKDSFTGFPVEIENYVYEYERNTRNGGIKSVTDKFCISVRDDKEYYYGAYLLNVKTGEEKVESGNWWNIGSREELDLYVNAVTYEEMKLIYGGMKITHNRMFNERTEYSDGKMKIIRQKLEVPVSQVILDLPPPSSEDEEEDEESDDTSD